MIWKIRKIKLNQILKKEFLMKRKNILNRLPILVKKSIRKLRKGLPIDKSYSKNNGKAKFLEFKRLLKRELKERKKMLKKK